MESQDRPEETERNKTMSEIWETPRIREAFIYDGGEADYYDPINGAKEQRRIAGEIFDRWLAAHDAEVRAERIASVHPDSMTEYELSSGGV